MAVFGQTPYYANTNQPQVDPDAWRQYVPQASQQTDLLPAARKVGPQRTGYQPDLFSAKGGEGGTAWWQKGGLGEKLKDKSSLSEKQASLLGLGGGLASALGNVIGKKHAKTGGFIGGAGKGAATGAAIGSFLPGPGTLIGGIAGGLFGGIKGLLSGKKKNKEKKAAELLAKQRAMGAPGLSAIGGGRPWTAGQLGPVVASDPYGQLRAETEARYRPTATPFTPMPQYTPTAPMPMSNNPWSGGDVGGIGSWGG